MAYRINEVINSKFPNELVVDEALVTLGLSIDTLIGVLRGYVCPVDLQAGQGYQMALANDLEAYLERELRIDGLRPTRSHYDLTYSPALRQHADFGLVHEGSARRILFEIEFRPNYEKDLVKFQIGANREILAAAVMIVTVDYRSINPRYPTMPEYESVARVIAEFRPVYPLLLIGLRGAHIA